MAGHDPDGAPLGPPPPLPGEAAAAARVRARLFGPQGRKAAPPTDPVAPSAGDTAPDHDGEPLPRRVGRFAIRGLLGRGAMGAVYLGYDPDLDREVAVKVLSDPGDEGVARAEERLRREAKALARLSHPNVVSVHEVGSHGGRVYLTMERIRGVTLPAWLRARQRSEREIVEVFVQVARGLFAAHQAGIVHRDVKPSNILVGHDGRTRVADFGLAAPGDPGRDDGTAPTPAAAAPTAVVSHSSDRMAGTLAFMAPERLRGEPATPASDQFSFCVTLWWAMFGEAPHPGKSAIARATAIATGRCKPPPPGKWASRHLLRVVRRGLQVDPKRRYPSMEALAQDLAADPARRRRRTVAMLAAAGAGALAAGILVATRPDPTKACVKTPTADATDADVAVARSLLTQAARTRGASIAPVLRRTLDDRIAALRAAERRACVERVSGLLSPERTSAVWTCLDLVRAETAALARAVADGPATSWAFAAQTADDLLPPERCLHDGPQVVGAVHLDTARDVVRDLVTARLARRRGAYRSAEAAAQEALVAAQSVRAPALSARARYALGTALERMGRLARAESELRLALIDAERAGDDLARVRITSYLVYVLGRSQGRSQEALQLASQVRGLLDALSAPPSLRADFESNLGAVLARAGRPRDALAAHLRALDLRRRAFGPDHPAALDSENALAAVRSSQGDHEAALAALDDLRDRARAVLGPEDPTALSIEGNRATALARSGRTPAAAAAFEALVEKTERALGRDAPMLPTWIFNLARAKAELGAPTEAAALLSRGIELRAEQGAEPRTLLPWLTARAAANRETGNLDAARDDLHSALRIALHARLPPARIASLHRSLADVLRASNAPAAQVDHHLRAAREAEEAAKAPDFTGRAAPPPAPAPSTSRSRPPRGR